MKLVAFFGWLILSIFLIMFIVFIPDVLHPYYYKIKYPNYCNIYENKSYQEIIDIFKDKSNYTKIEAKTFFVQCKNINAAPFIFSLRKTYGGVYNLSKSFKNYSYYSSNSFTTYCYPKYKLS